MSDQTKKPWHFGVLYAGQNLQWLPTDTQESYERMIQDPVHVEYFRQQGWLEPDAITYKINSEGFRSPEFEDNVNCMIALGCSYTMGTGLPVESLWPSQVAQALNLKVYNLAWPGFSADTCYRLARYWIPKLRPRVVAMLSPPRDRVELLMDPDTTPSAQVLMPQNQDPNLHIHDLFVRHWWLNSDNGEINNEKNVLAIQQLALTNGAKFVALRADKEMAKSREELGYARDHMHAGPRGHEIVAEKMLQEIEWH